jgi:hypothetical protein
MAIWQQENGPSGVNYKLPDSGSVKESTFDIKNVVCRNINQYYVGDDGEDKFGYYSRQNLKYYDPASVSSFKEL